MEGKGYFYQQLQKQIPQSKTILNLPKIIGVITSAKRHCFKISAMISRLTNLVVLDLKELLLKSLLSGSR